MPFDIGLINFKPFHVFIHSYFLLLFSLYFHVLTLRNIFLNFYAHFFIHIYKSIIMII